MSDPIERRDTAFDRVAAVALSLSEPRPASWIAGEADVAENTARDHLERLVTLGVLRAESEGRARVYRVDPLHERARDLGTLVDRPDDDLEAEAEDLEERIREFREEYGVEDPADLRTSGTESHPDPGEAEDRARVAREWEWTRYRLSLVRESLERYGGEGPPSRPRGDEDDFDEDLMDELPSTEMLAREFASGRRGPK